MAPLQALDARVYLAVNGAAHPPWLDIAFSAYTDLAVGGWVWIGGALGAALLGVPGSRRALLRLAPTVTATTLAVEYPVKAIFRRRRPFIDIVRALVVGKRPGSWSFPSGHTAAAFAAARVLTGVWPRATPAFFGLAALVGFSRVYVGAHYPGDVASGAFFGLTIAEVTSRLALTRANR
jgi:undecaprenyl-diphosphatase